MYCACLLALFFTAVAFGQFKPRVDTQVHQVPQKPSLISCIRNGDQEGLRRLLKNKANPNSPDLRDGIRPIQLATFKHNLAAVKLLAASGADVNALGRIGVPPLVTGSSNGFDDEVAFLLAHKALVNGATKEGLTALGVASNVQIARMLLRAGADIAHRDRNGITPLGVQCGLGNAEIAALLIKNGANVHVVAKNGDTLLHLTLQTAFASGRTKSYEKRYIAVLKLLRANHLSPFAQNKAGLNCYDLIGKYKLAGLKGALN